jgi:hypothetical protein
MIEQMKDGSIFTAPLPQVVDDDLAAFIKIDRSKWVKFVHPSMRTAQPPLPIAQAASSDEQEPTEQGQEAKRQKQ